MQDICWKLLHFNSQWTTAGNNKTEVTRCTQLQTHTYYLTCTHIVSFSLHLPHPLIGYRLTWRNSRKHFLKLVNSETKQQAWQKKLQPHSQLHTLYTICKLHLWIKAAIGFMLRILITIIKWITRKISVHFHCALVLIARYFHMYVCIYIYTHIHTYQHHHHLTSTFYTSTGCIVRQQPDR